MLVLPNHDKRPRGTWPASHTASARQSPSAPRARVAADVPEKSLHARRVGLFLATVKCGERSGGSRTGWRFRVRRLYETADLELQVHETLDTLAVRGPQTWFSWQHSAVAGASARLAVKPDNRKSYVLKLKDDDVAVAVLTNVVERIAETVPFLADPNNCWTCEASEMHILLSSHSARNDLLDLTPARRVCLCSSPVELRLAKLVWRRNGTLWAQWRVVRGNVDRLRADLRVVSGASVAGTFARTTEDPTRTRPFFVECLVMAVLHKPSSGDFRAVRALTEQLSAAFADTPCLLKHVYRLRSELCPLDRTGLYDVLPLMSQFPVIEGDLNRLIWGAKVLQASPCVRRIAGVCAGATLAACWLAWKKSTPR